MAPVSLRAVLAAATLAVFFASSAGPARADTERGDLFLAGGLTLAIPSAVDTLAWGVYRNRDHAWAWHLLPIVGPIVGIRELRQRVCEDETHGCPADKLLYVSSALTLAAQATGVVLLIVATQKDGPPRNVAAGLLPVSVRPADGGFVVGTGFAWD